MVDRAEELVLLSAQGEDLVTACTKMSEEEEKELGIAVSYPLQPSDYVGLPAKGL